MEQNLQTVVDLIKADPNLSEGEKNEIITRLNAADKKMTVDAFRIERGEHLKKTLSILLEETIEELEHKRKAVEEKNRDLEIEASLERVRTAAMAMRAAPDLLNICKILFEELTALGFGELRNAMINIANDEKGSFLNYDSNGSDSTVTQFLYNSHPVMERQVEMTRSASDAFFEHVLTGEDLKDFKVFRVKNGELPDPKLENVTTLYYYFYSIGVGSVGISAFSSLPEEKREVLKRFRNVFDLAYRRYADIQLAENQAREAQIELALERVRARTMAMQRSEELGETAYLLFQQFKELGDIPDQITIGIINEDERVIEFWITMEGNQTNRMFKVSVDERTLGNKLYTAWKKLKKSLVVDLSGKELSDYLTYRAKISGGAGTPTNDRSDDRRVINAAFFSRGLITVSAAEPRPDETIRLLERFAGVFDGTYTRFLDLKKAEAQAKESQIELALERVRARTMAMQRSEELSETAFILFQQFKELGENPDQATIGIINEEEHVIEYWVTMYGSQINKVFKFSIDEPNVTNRIYKGWTEKKTSLVIELTGKELNAFTKYREGMGGAKFNPEEKRRVINVAFFSKGLINVQSSEERSAESIRLLERFAGVFDGTYTRFLDLKKAEAQVREAQIEAALERTRTQSMIMQHSSELDDTLRVFHQQVLLLGIPSAFSFLWLPDEDKDRHIFWAAWAENNSNDFRSKAIDYPLDRNEPATAQCLVDWKGNEPVVSYHVPPDGVAGYFATWRELIDGVEQLKPEYFSGGLYYVEAFMKYGCFGVMVESSLSHDEKKILGRFAIEFERTYTRFLDLQKAEAQAREAQIELSLERVRAKTMAMHNSNDVGDTVAAMFDELVKLGVETLRCGILINADRDKMEVWTASSAQNADVSMIIGRLDMNIHPLLKGIYNAWAEKRSFFTYDLDGEDMVNYYTAINSLADYPVRFDIAALRGKQVHSDFFFPEGAIFAFTKDPIPVPSVQIFKRFAGVFGQTYRRYLDLQRAEAQAKESQIELALERVRACTMAMQKSDELKEIIKVVYEQLVHLNILAEHAGFIMDYRVHDDMHIWLADKHFDPSYVTVPYFDSPHWSSFNEAKKKGVDFFAVYSTFEEKNKFYQDLFALVPGVTEESREYYLNCPGLAISTVLLDNVGLYIENFSGIPYTDEENSTLMRFGKVFQQTYTRFLDLQKAEVQVREAQIEASLERVRSKTMAMHSSGDVAETVGVMFNELVKLGVEKMVRCGIGILTHGSSQMEVWTAKLGENEKTELVIGHFDMSIHPMLRGIYDSWENKAPSFSYVLVGDDMVNYFEAINNEPDYPMKYDISKLPVQQFHNDFFFSEGVLFAFTPNPLGSEISSIFKRFAGVFGQTYRRYLDLQKAEAQAKEAQIQLALERVRARTMAMQKSEELAETSVEVFKQLISLGIAPNRLFIGIIKDNSGDIELWATEEDGSKISTRFTGNTNRNGSVKKMYAGWKAQKKSLTIDMKGKELQEYFRYLAEDLKVPFKLGRSQKRRVQSIAYFSQGFIGMAAPEPQPEETINLMERFAGVFNLTYTRFNDLQKAEAQAREAIKQASVDRVRGEIASMRSTSDLDRITPLIWNELTILGIPFIRCGVFIMDEEEQLIHTHLSTADGKALATFNLRFDSEGIGQNVLPAWRQNQSATIHWTREEFADYTKNLVNQGTIKSGEKYVTEHPDTSLDLHFLPFLQGMLYVGNTSPLTADETDLVQSLADAFSTAYARYEDFNKLEAAKQQVENTLSDLKAAQTKLIQSEKMASLGELTAGIAHEIQNPLNFVNNFSEVNQEMIDELEEELKSGNIDEALAIAADIKQNEQKINHHGKRADGIVKGMLQHSRTGGGEKQMISMNVLADEFMRLSYHGLRAKDKTFNAEMIIHFDPDLPKTNVIGQDMGRVLLNLFNNAFYAVNQKKKSVAADYKPEVTVSTSTENGQVLIKVKDNGVGIPETIKEKIMQPFFTTKPTGEGTGLGLSLTYDMVVKGHGGSILVDTKEGEYTEFTVILPVS